MSTYPVSEVFWSIQGEGCYTGAVMKFIRLAGCNVGEYRTPELDKDSPRIARPETLIASYPGMSVCTNVFGQTFLCDTDYRIGAGTATSVGQLANAVGKGHRVCITGGEPFLYDLQPLVSRLLQQGADVHIETNGTLKIPANVGDRCWITCSPKKGFCDGNRMFVNEWKHVLNMQQSATDLEKLLTMVTKQCDRKPCFVQAANFPYAPHDASVQQLLHLLLSWKPQADLRFSAQLHKYLRLP